MDIFLEVVSKKHQTPNLSSILPDQLWSYRYFPGWPVFSPPVQPPEQTSTFSCSARHQETFILPFKSSMFTQWIILNAGWGKNHRARSPPPVITSRGEGLRNGVGRSHTFFWRCMWLLPCHRDRVCFLRRRSWSLLDMLFIRVKRGIQCVTINFNHRFP